MENCKHYWRVIETDEFGVPTKYECVMCLLIYIIKRDTKKTEYLKKLFDKINDLTNKIAEIKQRIELIKCNYIGIDEKIHIVHLEKELGFYEKILDLTE